jgi:ribosome-associated translation inhibitor RaiA
MEIYFKLIHQDVPKGLLTRTEKKIARLDKLTGEGKFEAQAYVEITKATGAHHSEAAWRASINVDAAGDRFHAEASEATPERAADRAVRELESELRTHHARERSIRRKANGFWKSLMQNDFRSP